ncbi:hypothetical protein KKH36_00520 [Patescibacteria group bacterium]|nr:hypothetical protein [Patescibacteria group bacterium]
MKFFKKITIQIFKKTIIVVVSLFVIYSVGLATGSGINTLNIDTEAINFDRILFVPGINTNASDLVRWKRDLTFNFPEKEIIFIDDFVYFYWQDDKTEKIVNKGVEILNDGKSTLVIAHSYGGLLVKSIIEKAENGNVVKLITMASPHKVNALGVAESKTFLEVPEEVNVPTYSFGGYVDWMVLFPDSNVEDSQHEDLWSGHSGFLFNKDIRKKVLEFALGLSYVE